MQINAEGMWVIRKHDEKDPDHKYYNEDCGWTNIDEATLYSQKEKAEHLIFTEEWVLYGDAAREEGIEACNLGLITYTKDVVILGNPEGTKFLSFGDRPWPRVSHTVDNPIQAQRFPTLEEAISMSRETCWGSINEDNLHTIYIVRLTGQLIERREPICKK